MPWPMRIGPEPMTSAAAAVDRARPRSPPPSRSSSRASPPRTRRRRCRPACRSAWRRRRPSRRAAPRSCASEKPARRSDRSVALDSRGARCSRAGRGTTGRCRCARPATAGSAPLAQRGQQREEPPVVGLVDEVAAPSSPAGGRLLLERAHRLHQRRLEGPLDRHHLAGRLHLRAEPPVAGGKLVERPARDLDHAVVERRLEGGERAAGDLVADLVQAPARPRSWPRRGRSGSRSPWRPAPTSG